VSWWLWLPMRMEALAWALVAILALYVLVRLVRG
jgi:hypothetical protein